MRYEISSGNGPAECELAVTKFAQYIVKKHGATLTGNTPGYNQGTYKTVKLECDTDLSGFAGSVLWICKSPYRPEHKRKNWFINFKQADTASQIIFDQSKVVYTACHSRGNGGQNVNKVETGIRAEYPPTGDVTVCTDERSQYANKKKAAERLKEIVEQKNKSGAVTAANSMRVAHVNLQRGNASAVFCGVNFERILER